MTKILTTTSYILRHGSVHGLQHMDWRINNQDKALSVQYSTVGGRTYRIGLVSDGCTGIAEFSKTEVGANLIVLFCMGQIQELTFCGVPVAEIPTALYPRLARFLNRLATDIFPARVTAWPYPFKFEGDQAFRNDLSPADRFKTDYLAATILGYVDDGETLVTFYAGDGVVIINGNPQIIDQNNQPRYVALHPNGTFETRCYPSAAIRQLAVATDGIKGLLRVDGLNVASKIFSHQRDDDLGLQSLLLELCNKYGEHMGDDCGIVTRERVEG